MTPRKQPNPRLKKRQVRHAMKGTGGSYTRLAKNLGRSVQCVHAIFKPPRKGWEKVHAAWEIESNRLCELSEDILIESFRKGADPKIASANARFVLSRRHKKYMAKQKVSVDEVPEKKESGVTLDQLSLPLQEMIRDEIRAIKKTRASSERL